MTRRPARTRALPLAIACLGALAGSAVRAQQIPEGGVDTWRFAVGGGVLSVPQYPGSSKHKTEAVPLLSANYGRYFIGGSPDSGVPAGLGVNLVDNAAWKFGLGVGYDITKPRKESDDERLRGLGDVKSTAKGTVFGSYTRDWFKIRGAVATDIGGHHEGTTATLDLEGEYRITPSFALTAGPGLTWADSKYTRTFFGVDATQSANSGRPQYDAKSGLNTLRFTVGAQYLLSRNWVLGARASAGTLRGDARNSPVTSSTSQNSVALFGIYRF